MRVRGTAIFVTAVFLFGLAGCAVNPVTGERELALVGEEQEIAMGQQGAASVRESIGLVDDPELQSYVDRVGQALAADSERPDLPWSFGVLDDPTPNAFALPGGPIFITRGLMSLMTSEAELAAVLGHEVGHITAKHSVQQLSRAQLAQLGIGLGTILYPEARPVAEAASTGLQLLFLKYGRDAERQADALGFKYMLDEGYDVAEMDDLFMALERSGELAGRSALPGWLATHPSEAERIENTRQRVAALPPKHRGTRVGRETYLRQIEGLAFGDDPRNGYFDDGVFYHPKLAFRFSVPEAWNTQNLPQAVLAVTEAQDAGLQLTLVDAADAGRAARAFLTENQLTVEQSSTTDVNGLAAVTARFSQQTERGAIRGNVAFYEYDGRVYRLVGYTAAEQYPAYADAFRQSIGSFRRVTDQSVLNVTVPRIEIVEVPSPMSLAEFDRRYPSSIDLERLALINQVEGADARLPAGTMVKRVTQ